MSGSGIHASRNLVVPFMGTGTWYVICCSTFMVFSMPNPHPQRKMIMKKHF